MQILDISVMDYFYRKIEVKQLGIYLNEIIFDDQLKIGFQKKSAKNIIIVILFGIFFSKLCEASN